MKRKIILLSLLLLVTLLASSCEAELQTSSTITPEKPMVVTTSTLEPFVPGECNTAAERIEMNQSYNKGVGCGYTDLKYGCAMYCLWVPEGSQLRIGIKDSFSDLKLIVKRDLFEDADSEEGWISDKVGRYQDELVTIENPGGRYYIAVCPKAGASCSFRGNAVVFTSAALFTLNSEFVGFPSKTVSNEADSTPLVIPSSEHAAYLTVRTGPGRQYSPTKYQIPMESGATLVGRTADGNWLLVEFGSTQGWVPASEVTVSGSYSLVPIIEGTPATTSTPEPCLRRIAEAIIGDRGFEELRTELIGLVERADETPAEDLGPIINQLEELLVEIKEYEFPPPTSSNCTERAHAALVNYAYEKGKCYSIKYTEYIDEADYTDDIKLMCNRAKSYEDNFNLLFKELEEVVEEE
jgi:hypothetical protein